MNPVKEYKIVADNDGHLYVILITQEKLFERWVKAMEAGGKGPKGFEPDQIDGLNSICFPGWRKLN